MNDMTSYLVGSLWSIVEDITPQKILTYIDKSNQFIQDFILSLVGVFWVTYNPIEDYLQYMVDNFTDNWDRVPLTATGNVVYEGSGYLEYKNGANSLEFIPPTAIGGTNEKIQPYPYALRTRGRVQQYFDPTSRTWKDKPPKEPKHGDVRFIGKEKIGFWLNWIPLATPGDMTVWIWYNTDKWEVMVTEFPYDFAQDVEGWKIIYNASLAQIWG